MTSPDPSSPAPAPTTPDAGSPEQGEILPAPNHHADHEGFSGIKGYLSALTMLVGRKADAELAVERTGTGPGDHVVDVGSGPGSTARRAARAGAGVTGVEPASVMRDLA